MQKETTKKSKKLIILIAILAAAVLVTGGIVLAVVLGQGPATQGETGPVGGRPDLYWNLDRMAFTNGGVDSSSRVADANGQYHIRFAYNGEVVEYTTTDKRLVNAVDSMDIVGLVKDENGNLIDAMDPATVATEVSKDTYIQKISDEILNVNSSVAMNGMEASLTLCELTQIYDVLPDSENPGSFGQVELMDQIRAFANDKGELTHVYIVARQPKSDIYWRVEPRNVDSKGVTKREPDENGVYHILFAVNGEQVTLKCKDKEIVNEIDGMKDRLCDTGLLFDEEGYITGLLESTVAIRGKLLGAAYNVTALEGNSFTATYLMTGNNAGKTISGTIDENTKIYNVCLSDAGEYIGEPTQLQDMDRLIVYTDMDGNVVEIFVVYRMVDGELCYNVNRMYSGGKTTRKPDANGYYKFLVSIDGKQRTIRTKDVNLATKLDSYSSKIAGVVLDGDIIKFVCQDYYITGHNRYAASSSRVSYGVLSSILSFTTAGVSPDESMINLVMTPDVKIYDVSGRPGTTVGEPGEVHDGDLIRVIADIQDNITHIYVEAAYSGHPVYWNLSRKYSSATDGTTRTPNADGYYVYEMASKGKEVTVKTKNKEIADYIDRQSPAMVALEVKGGIIRSAHPATSAYQYGYKRASSAYYERSIGKKIITVWNYLKSSTSNINISKDLKIYNVSGVYDSHPGEETTLRQGDRVQGIAISKTAELVELYVFEREVSSKIYVNQKRMYSSTTGETTRKPRESDGYYVFDLAVDGQLKNFKTKSKEIATAVDANSRAFGLKVDGNVIKAVYPITGVKGVKAESIVNYDVMKINGRKVEVEYKWPGSSSVGKTATVELASDCKIYDVSSYAKSFGQKTTLSAGDRVYALKNDDGKVSHIFIKYKNTREAGHIGYCEHCKQDVYWHPYLNTTYDDVHHAYLTADVIRDGSLQISDKDTPAAERQELVLDLNGKTLTAATRAFWVYGKLSIVDSSKAKTGKIVGANSTTGKQLQAIAISDGGEVNLYSGTLTRNPEATALTGGGGVVKVTANTTFNMYGGTIEGGIADEGGNIFVQNATVNIYGGKITGGTAASGANIYAKGTAVLNIQGGEIDGDIAIEAKNTVKIGGTAKINKGTTGGLQIPSGYLLSLKDITKDTKVCVDATGVFTEVVENADNYLGNFYSSEELLPISNMEGALTIGLYKECPHCDGQKALFGKFSRAAATGNAHLIVLEDMELDTQLVIGSEGDTSADVVVDLNGKTITLVKEGATSGHKTGRFALVYANLSIMDSSAEKTGTIYSNVENIDNNAGMIQMMQNSSVNIYGGTLAANEKLLAKKGGIIYAGGDLTMYDGVISGGSVKADAAGGNIMVRPTGSFTMKGGKITGGKAAQGGNIIANAGATVRLEGGVIENGTATGQGGNIYVDGANVVVGKDFVIKHGTADIGGNIYVAQDTAALDVQAGAQILGGTATTKAQSVYVSATADSVTVAGTVKAEKASAESEATGGDVLIEGTAATIAVTGAAKIDKLTIPDGLKINANGLTEGAKIKVQATGIFTNELESESVAADYITNAYFESLTATPVTQDAKALRCGLGAGEVIPENYTRQCSHCGQEVEFTPLSEVEFANNKENIFDKAGQTYHVILTEEETTLVRQFCVGGTDNDNAKRDVTVVVDFNGKTVKNAGGRLATVFGKLYIQDTSAEKDGKFIGGASNTGGMIYVTNASSSAAKSLVENKTPELINEAVAYVKDIDLESTVTSSTSNGGGIAVSYGALYMENVKVLNGKAGAGGSIYGLWSNVELTNCELLNGTAVNGGNINVAACYLTVNGGKIGGGSATTAGDNIYARHNNTVVTLTNVVFDNGTATDRVDLHVKNAPPVTVAGVVNMKVNFELAGTEIGQLTLGQLEPNSLITFTAGQDGPVTVANDKINEYFNAGYFAAGDGKTVSVSGDQLVIG